MRSRWGFHLLVLLAYTVLALALTWPLAAHLGTHVPGNGSDDPPLTWNLWWVQHALLDLGTNPFHSDYLFYPIGINLAFYTLTLLNGLLSIPLQATVGLIPASNLLLLSSFVLSGYGAFLLAAYLLRTAGEGQAGKPAQASWSGLVAPLAAGLVYAFASSKMFYAALGQWNIASSQWIPFYVLCLFRMSDDPQRWRYPLLAGVFLLLQAYAELTYASFLILFTLLWGLWHGLALLRLPRSASLRESAGRWAIDLMVVALLFVVGLAPILAVMIPDLRAEGDIFATGGGFAGEFSADLAGFLVPTQLHPLFGHLVGRLQLGHTVGQHIYLGYGVLFLALVGAIGGWRRGQGAPPVRSQGANQIRFWSLSTVVWWLFTLGPTLRWNGQTLSLPMPFAIVEQMPFLKGNRYPSRYSVLLTLSVAMLAAYGLASIVTWARSRWSAQERTTGKVLRRTVPSLVPGCLVLLMLFEHLSAPLPLSDMRVPPVYGHLSAVVPGDSTLLDLPVAWRNGSRVTGTLDPIIMFEQYYQTAHRRRILAGNTSRNPPLKFQYFTEAPVINSLIALETGHSLDASTAARDRALAATVLRFFSIGGIVVRPAEAGPDVLPYVEATLPVSRSYEGDGTVAYRVQLPEWPDSWSVQPGHDLARLSYAEGWGVPSGGSIWAQRRKARLLVPMNGQSQRMAFSAYAPLAGQRLTVVANGQAAAELELAPGWREYDASLPASLLKEGLNEISLRFDEQYPTREVRLSPRAIGQTGVDSPANLVVQSAGLDVGDLGQIYVNGRQVSPDQRGYNVVVIEPESGAVEAVAAFDTHGDEGASRAMAAFLNEVPLGHVVLVAAADEASRLLGQEAVDALHGIGAVGDLRGKFRWGHAIVGVRGSTPGSAAEAMDWMRPVGVTVGEGATEARLAAAFGPITFTATPAP